MLDEQIVCRSESPDQHSCLSLSRYDTTLKFLFSTDVSIFLASYSPRKASFPPDVNSSGQACRGAASVGRPQGPAPTVRRHRFRRTPPVPRTDSFRGGSVRIASYSRAPCQHRRRAQKRPSSPALKTVIGTNSVIRYSCFKKHLEAVCLAFRACNYFLKE